jgi:hypothetical protein
VIGKRNLLEKIHLLHWLGGNLDHEYGERERLFFFKSNISSNSSLSNKEKKIFSKI